jgi:ABC-type xylose transport system permease subunit
MDLSTTLIGMAAAAAIFAWANWRQRKERDRTPGDVSLVPLTLIQMAAVVAVVVLVGHLISLATGVPFQGRMNY